jgi:NADPH:quinone reductase-like Zn-dependent oxidoreductase
MVMQAAVVHAIGQSPTYQSFADPVPENGEALIKVHASGLHPIVRALASGEHYLSSAEVPFIPGVDGAGELEDGRRVYFGFVRKPWGTMAEMAAAPKDMCIALPDNLDYQQAAAIANPGMSAWLTLKDRGALKHGETVLVLGATGVAGHLAIQAARLLGASRIIAAGRNVGALNQSDVDQIIPLGEPEDAIRDAFTTEMRSGIDLIIDYLWGRPAELLLEALAKGFRAKSTHRTRWVEVGESAGKTITLPGATLRSVDLTMMGSGFGSTSLDRIIAAIPTLFSMAVAGTLRIAVEPFPLAEVGSVWNRIEKGRRIVFTV